MSIISFVTKSCALFTFSMDLKPLMLKCHEEPCVPLSKHTHPLFCVTSVDVRGPGSKAVELPQRVKRIHCVETPSSPSLRTAAPNGRNLHLQESGAAAVRERREELCITVIITNHTNAFLKYLSVLVIFPLLHLSCKNLVFFFTSKVQLLQQQQSFSHD